MLSAEESGEGDSCLLGLRTEIPNVSSVRRRSGTPPRAGWGQEVEVGLGASPLPGV